MEYIDAFVALSQILREHGAQAFVDLKTRVTSIAQAKRPSGVYEAVDLDIDFAGDLENCEKLFEFVMEVQFGNFTKGSVAYGPIALAMLLVKHLFQMQKSDS